MPNPKDMQGYPGRSFPNCFLFSVECKYANVVFFLLYSRLIPTKETDAEGTREIFIMLSRQLTLYIDAESQVHVKMWQHVGPTISKDNLMYRILRIKQ